MASESNGGWDGSGLPTVVRDLEGFLLTGQLVAPEEAARIWKTAAAVPTTALEAIELLNAAGAITHTQGETLKRAFGSAQRARLEEMLQTAQAQGLASPDSSSASLAALQEFDAKALVVDPRAYLVSEGLLTSGQAEGVRTDRLRVSDDQSMLVSQSQKSNYYDELTAAPKQRLSPEFKHLILVSVLVFALFGIWKINSEQSGDEDIGLRSGGYGHTAREMEVSSPIRLMQQNGQYRTYNAESRRNVIRMMTECPEGMNMEECAAFIAGSTNDRAADMVLDMAFFGLALPSLRTGTPVEGIRRLRDAIASECPRVSRYPARCP